MTRIFISLLFLTINCWADTLPSKNVLVVTEDLPPFAYMLNGQVEGLGTQLIHAIHKELGVSTEVELLTWARAYKIASTEPNVLIFTIARTEAREDLFHWLLQVDDVKSDIFSRPKLNIHLDSLADIKHESIGVIRGGSNLDHIRSYENITSDNLLLARSFEQLYLMTKLGRIDLFECPVLIVKYLNKRFNTPLLNQPVSILSLPVLHEKGAYIALSLETPLTTVHKYRTAIQALTDNGNLAQIRKEFIIKLEATDEM